MYSKIFSATDIELVSIDPQGGNEVPLTNAVGKSDMAEFSPDGSKIAFASTRGDGSNYRLYVMNADGTDQTDLVDTPRGATFPAWSPSGDRLAFSLGRIIQIYTFATGDVQSLRTPPNGNLDIDPAWLPATLTENDPPALFSRNHGYLIRAGTLTRPGQPATSTRMRLQLSQSSLRKKLRFDDFSSRGGSAVYAGKRVCRCEAPQGLGWVSAPCVGGTFPAMGHGLTGGRVFGPTNQSTGEGTWCQLPSRAQDSGSSGCSS